MGNTIFNEKGEPVYIIGAAQDITDRKNTEHHLPVSEKHYKSLIEYNTSGIIATNLHGLITHANTAFLDLVGYSLEELMGLSPVHLIVEEDWERLIRELDITSEVGKGTTVSIRLPFTESKKYIGQNPSIHRN